MSDRREVRIRENLQDARTLSPTYTPLVKLRASPRSVVVESPAFLEFFQFVNQHELNKTG